MLQGLLCTPNSLAEDIEYWQLCQFAVENGADYVLLNPLSSMGPGVEARQTLATTEDRMLRIHQMIDPFAGPNLDVVCIRFANTAGKPLAGCEAGRVIYVFAHGEVTVCPYPTCQTFSPIPSQENCSSPSSCTTNTRLATSRRLGVVTHPGCC